MQWAIFCCISFYKIFLTRKNISNLQLHKLVFFLYQIFFLYLTKQEKYIYLFYILLYIQEWGRTHFSLLDIKLCFSSLLFRNAKLASFFFVRFYLSTKTKIQCRNETLYFPYTYIDFSAVFALVFLIFLLDLMIFSIKKVQIICLNSFIYRIFWTFQNFFQKIFNFL